VLTVSKYPLSRQQRILIAPFGGTLLEVMDGRDGSCYTCWSISGTLATTDEVYLVRPHMTSIRVVWVYVQYTYQERRALSEEQSLLLLQYLPVDRLLPHSETRLHAVVCATGPPICVGNTEMPLPPRLGLLELSTNDKNSRCSIPISNPSETPALASLKDTA